MKRETYILLQVIHFALTALAFGVLYTMYVFTNCIGFAIAGFCLMLSNMCVNQIAHGRLKNKVKTEPMICPACKTPYWRTKRKNKKNGVKGEDKK